MMRGVIKIEIKSKNNNVKKYNKNNYNKIAAKNNNKKNNYENSDKNNFNKNYQKNKNDKDEKKLKNNVQNEKINKNKNEDKLKNNINSKNKIIEKMGNKIINLKIIKNISEKNNKINEGNFKNIDYISPTYINLNNPKYLEMEDYFYSGIIIVNYAREQDDLILKSLIEANINMNISMFYEKGDKIKALKEISYNIGNVGVELNQFNENRQDMDIALFTYNDAKYIRKEIQIDGEEIYFLYIYLSIFSRDKKELEHNLDKVETILQSKGMQTKRANFRQEQLFLSCLPLAENNSELKKVGKRNILTKGLISTYPFISSSIFIF